MLEYSTVLGKELGGDLAGNFLYLLDTILNSPYLWPGVVITIAGIALLARQFSK